MIGKDLYYGRIMVIMVQMETVLNISSGQEQANKLIQLVNLILGILTNSLRIMNMTVMVSIVKRIILTNTITQSIIIKGNL